MIGIIYATGSLLPRRVIVSDNPAEFKAACALVEGESLIIRDRMDSLALEALRAVIAEQTGVAVEDQPSGRCAVVAPDNREVIELIVADPALDSIGREHPIGGSKACELHASDDAKLFDRITAEGARLARVVTGGRDGKVTAVEWVDPRAIPERHFEESFAKVGQTVAALKLTDVPSEGARKL